MFFFGSAALYAQLGLGWVCRRYARWLLHALQSTEKLLYGVGAVLAPLGIKLAQRFVAPAMPAFDFNVSLKFISIYLDSNHGCLVRHSH